MKKNRMMRLASILLVCVLLTTSVISGTFAKYVTEGTTMDSARVAKWGVTITANGSTFAEKYDDVAGDNGAQVVAANGTDKVVAPGTEGELVEMVLAGTPEVAFSVDYEATLVLNYWTVKNGVEYCPIVFTVNSETYGTVDTNATHKSANVADLITAVEEAIENYSAEYDANQNLATESDVATPDVSWKWEFEGNDDEKDTYLGDKAAAGTPAEISLTIVTTITQLD